MPPLRDPNVPPPWMNEYERSIRKKVYEANILTPGEWVYLVGVFGAAREHDAMAGFFNSLPPEQQKAALEYRGDDC